MIKITKFTHNVNKFISPFGLFYETILTMKEMKNNEITEAQLLLNQQVVVTSHMSRFTGRKGIVNKVMADGRTLDVTLDGVGDVFLDVTLVGEVRDTPNNQRQEQSLGPNANSVVQDTI